MKETNTMNDIIQKCAACGSIRVVTGQLMRAPNDEGQSHGTDTPVGFGLSELKEKSCYWTIFSIRELPRAVLIHRPGSANACLDCGNVSASLSLNVKEATKVLEKSGTDAVKARLAIAPPAS